MNISHRVITLVRRSSATLFAAVLLFSASAATALAAPTLLTAVSVSSVVSASTVSGEAYTVAWQLIPNSGVPTGTVEVKVNGNSACSGPVSVVDGTGSCSVSDAVSTSAGVKSIVVYYSGDGDFFPSDSSALPTSHTVTKADTSVSISNAVSLAATPTYIGDSYAVTWSASVTAPGAGAPSGNITVSDGTDDCTAAFSAGTCSLTSTTFGPKTLTASYAGDANYNGSDSAGDAHTVKDTNVYVGGVGASDLNDGSVATPFATIQHGVDIAPADGTVHVAAGTYNELVTITKSLHLEGANLGVDARGGSRGAESIIDGTALGGAVWVNGNGITVSIDGFTIQNVAFEAAQLNAGITTVQSSNLTDLQILNNIIQGVPIGIAPQGDNALIQYNLVQNTVDGPAGHTGIYTDFGLTGSTIDNNSFVNNDNESININSSGGTNVISNNTMDSGIYLHAQTGSEVTDNTVTNSFGAGITLGGNQSGIVITGNVVNGVADGYSALRLRDDAGGPNSGLTITDNEFNAGALGYGVRPGSGSYTGTLTLSSNQITSGLAAVQNDDAALNVDASGNWWGTSNGPTIASNANTGRGDAILGAGSSLVDYRPWCLTDACSPVDTIVPTIDSVTIDPVSPVKAGTVAVTVVFNDDGDINTALSPVVTITGLTSGPLAVTQTSYSGDTWVGTAVIPAPPYSEQAGIAVSVSGAEDASGNQLVAVPSATTFDVDTLPPAIVAVGVTQGGVNPSWLKIGDTLTFTVNPAKAEPGATISGSYNGNTLSWGTMDGGLTYSAVYTVVSGDTNQSSPLQITGVTVTDTAGNISFPGNSSLVTKNIDANAPSVTLSATNSNPTNAVLSVTATFSEVVSGFDDTDLGITNGVVSSFATTDSIHYTFTVTPTSDGDVTVDVAGAVATDVAGNASTATGTLTRTYDHTAPVVTVPSDFTEEATSPSGATGTFSSSANDAHDGVVSTTCSPVSGSTFALGTTLVTCSATDTAGNTGSDAFNLTVEDTTVPVITLVGSDPVTVEGGATYSDAGATAADDYDGNLTSSIVTVNPVNTAVVGDYIVTYNITDAHSNAATQVTRTVYVVDTAAPVLTAHADVTMEATGSTGATVPFTDPTAVDAVDGARTVTCSPLSGSVFGLGTTVVTCSATDLSAHTGTRTFNVVVADTTAPVITLTGDAQIDMTVGGTYSDVGATATDIVDGDLTSSIVVVNPVDVLVPGTYVITYNVIDAATNAATQVTRTVVVNRRGGGGGHVGTPSAEAPGRVLGASSYNFSSDLTIGSTGDDVVELQKILIAGGFLKIAAPTGFFGPMTAAAVKLYQAAHSIPATGFVGPLTRAALNGEGTPVKTTAEQIAELMAKLKLLQAQLGQQ